MWATGKVPPLPRRVLRPGWEAPADERYLYVAALDPGEASGWWVLRCAWTRLQDVGFRRLALGGEGFAATGGEFTGPEPYQAELFLAVCRGLWTEGDFGAGPDADLFLIVVEDFILRVFSQDRALLAPVRVTSCVEALSWRTLPAPVVRFSSSDTKKIVTDPMLRDLNLYRAGPDHLRDAARCAVLGARRMLEPGFQERALARMAWLAEGGVAVSE